MTATTRRARNQNIWDEKCNTVHLIVRVEVFLVQSRLEEMCERKTVEVLIGVPTCLAHLRQQPLDCHDGRIFHGVIFRR